MIDTFITVLFSLLAVVNAILLVLFFLPERRKIERDRGTSRSPPLSIIIPAHNEEKYIESTIKSILGADYRNKKEIIVVDDGSADRTGEIVKRLARKNRNIRLFDIRHSGKSAALNYGLQKASFDIVAYLDADSSIGKKSLLELVKPLADKNTAISSGIIRARHTNNILSWFQDFEYIVSSSWRYACDKIGATYIAPGFAAFKKSALVKVGGFSKDTLTEDIDTTLVLRKKGYKAAMTSAVLFTSVPSSFRGLLKQRIRWGRGSVQTARKHVDILFSRKAGLVGLYSFPMHLFWYVFAMIYMPFAIYWVGSVYFSSGLGSMDTILFMVKWFTVYGIADILYNISAGYYALTPLLASIVLSWLLSFAYLLLSMRKFSALSWKMLSYIVIFPYYWAIFIVQGVVLVYEAIRIKTYDGIVGRRSRHASGRIRENGNIWNKLGGNSV